MKKIFQIVMVMLVVVGVSQKSFSQTSVVQAQASFIYNFTRFIEWPASHKSGDFVIGVLSSSAMYSELQSFTTNKKVGTQNIVIKKLKSLDEINGIHMLFVPFERTKDLGAIESKAAEGKTVIITEKTGALDHGSSINFIITEDNKLKYETKVSNSTKFGLKCNSVLETMAIARF